MAITRAQWQNVAAPNSSGALQALSDAGRQVSSNIANLGNVFLQADASNKADAATLKQSNTDKAIASIMGARSTDELAGLTALDSALSKENLNKTYGEAYDPAQVAQAIAGRESQLYGRETDASQYQDTLNQRDIVNTRADASLQLQQDQFANTVTNQQDTRAEVKRKNAVAEQLAQDKFDAEKTKVATKAKAGEPPKDETGAPIYGLVDVGKLTGEQGKSAGFAASMADSMAVIDGVVGAGFNPSSAMARAESSVPDALGGNIIQSKEGQQVDTAYKNIVSAILRSETGAGFGKPEKVDVEDRIIPKAGDSKEVLIQKRKYLDVYLDAMSKKSGGGYVLNPAIAERGNVWGDLQFGLTDSSSIPSAENRNATSTITSTPPATPVQINGANLQFNGGDVSEAEVTELMNRYGLDRASVLTRLGG